MELRFSKYAICIFVSHSMVGKYANMLDFSVSKFFQAVSVLVYAKLFHDRIIGGCHAIKPMTVDIHVACRGLLSKSSAVSHSMILDNTNARE